MIRTAHAIWSGDLKGGKGVLSTQSKGLNETQYSFRTRFEDGVGVNPEELIAAAHSSCFAMATSAQLGERGITPESVDVTAAVTMENLSITRSALTCTITAPGANRDEVEAAAQAAKAGCPISKVLNAEITLDLTINV
jgi:osmotically inducible protein OsmC